MVPVNLEDREKAFITALFENKGNVLAATRIAGYSPGHSYNLVKRLREQIIEAAEHMLALHAPRAVGEIIGAMDEDGTTPAANIRLEAAKQVLDRVGISRKERLEVDTNAPTALFILPDKNKD